MQDVASAVTLALGKMIDEGAIEKMIRTHLEKTIDDILRDQLRSYSAFGKTVSAAIEQALTFPPDRQLTLPSYNSIVVDIVRRHLDGKMRQDAADHLKRMLGEILADPPKEIKLSELVEDYKSHIKDGYDGETYEAVTCIVERTDYGSIWLSLGKGRNVDKYRCPLRLLLSKPSSREPGPLTVGTIWNTEQEWKQAMFIADRSGFERKLYALWVNKVPIVLDEDAVDIELIPED